MFKLSRIARVIFGVALIGYAIDKGNHWFFLGITTLAIELSEFYPIFAISSNARLRTKGTRI